MRTLLLTFTILSSTFIAQARAQDAESPDAESPDARPQTADDENRVLPLEQLLHLADAHSPALQAARAQQGIVESRRRGIFRIPSNPELSFTGGVRNVGSAAGFDFEVALTQAFEIGGQPARRRELNRRQREAAEAQTAEVRRAVHTEIRRLYAQLQVVAERRAQLARFTQLSQEVLRIAEGRVEAGDASVLQRLVAESDLAQSQQAELALAATAAQLHSRIAAIAGWSETPWRPDAAAPSEDFLGGQNEEQLIARLRDHPTAQQRAAQLEAAGASIRLEDRQGLPDLTLGASFAQEANPGAGAGPASHIASLTVALPLPLVRRNQEGQARAQANRELAEAQLRQGELQLRNCLRQGLIALETARAQRNLYRENILPAQEESLRLLERSFELGEADAQTVSLTRSRLLSAGAQALNAELAYRTALATLWGLLQGASESPSR